MFMRADIHTRGTPSAAVKEHIRLFMWTSLSAAKSHLVEQHQYKSTA